MLVHRRAAIQFLTFMGVLLIELITVSHLWKSLSIKDRPNFFQLGINLFKMFFHLFTPRKNLPNFVYPRAWNSTTNIEIMNMIRHISAFMQNPFTTFILLCLPTTNPWTSAECHLELLSKCRATFFRALFPSK